MVPPLTDMPHGDNEFDLDVRLEGVARPDRAEKPGPEGTVTCSCPPCPTGLTCGCSY